VTLVLLAGSVFGQSVMLKPRLDPGKNYFLEIDSQTEQSVLGSSGAKPMTSSIHSLYGYTVKTEAQAGGGFHLTFTYDHVLMTFTAGGGSQGYDSDSVTAKDDEENMIGAAMAPMKGAAITLDIDASGKATAAHGAEQLVATIEKAASGNPVVAQMKEELKDESFRLELGELRFALYPNKEVKQGDTWSSTVEADMPPLGKLKLTFDCKATKVEKKGDHQEATVEYTGKIASNGQVVPAGNGMNIKLESGAMKGTATFDSSVGQYVHAQEDSDLKFALNPDDAAKAGKIDIQKKSTQRILSEAQREEQRKSAASAKPAAPATKPAQTNPR
jgi:hypothetical protein